MICNWFLIFGRGLLHSGIDCLKGVGFTSGVLTSKIVTYPATLNSGKVVENTRLKSRPIRVKAPKFIELLLGQNRVLKLIAEGKPLYQTLDLLLRMVEKQSPGMLASILLLEPDGIHVHHGAAPSLPEAYVKAIDSQPIGPEAGSCGTAAYRKEAVIVEDIATDPLWRNYCSLALQHGLHACWSTPIFDEQHNVLGTFALYFRQPGRPNRRHRMQIAMVTNTAAIAILKKQREDALRVRETQLGNAQAIAHFGSYEWLPAIDTVRWTEELFRIFGLQPGEIQPTGVSYLERVHPDDREATRKRIEQSLFTGAPFEGEERIVLPDGSIRVLFSRGQWLLDENQQTRKLVGTCQDITFAHLSLR